MSWDEWLLSMHGGQDVESFLLSAFQYDVTSRLRSGVVHVTSVFPVSVTVAHADCFSDLTYHTIRIAPRSPKSIFDAFMLSLTRASADFVIATGKIVRCEPDYTVECLSPFGPALEDWRTSVLHRAAPPQSVVLTAQPDVDVSHVLFQRAKKPLPSTQNACGSEELRDKPYPVVLFTNAQVAPQLERLISSSLPSDCSCVSVQAHPQCSISTAVDYCLKRPDATISIEAGPRSSLDLYRCRPIRVDTLLLSIYHGAVSDTQPAPADEESKCAMHVQSASAVLAMSAGPFLTQHFLDQYFQLAARCVDGDWEFRVYAALR